MVDPTKIIQPAEFSEKLQKFAIRVNEYIETLLAEDRLGARGPGDKAYHFRRFLRYLRGIGLNVNHNNVSRQLLEDYIRHMRAGRRNKPETWGQAITTIRCFFQWHMLEHGTPAKNPAEKIRARGKTRKLPRPLTKDEIRLLMAGIDASTRLGSQLQLMVELMYAGALRAGECINLKVGELSFGENDQDPGVVTVYGKSQKYRKVFFPADLKAGLLEYIDSLDAAGANDCLFPSEYIKGRPITYETVRRNLENTAYKLGIKEFGCHRLRHSAASHMRDAGADLFVVSKYLGHASANTTLIYAGPSATEVARKYRKLMPTRSLSKVLDLMNIYWGGK